MIATDLFCAGAAAVMLLGSLAGTYLLLYLR